MKQTLIDLFTSKKFLAALTAVVVYVAGRFGFNVDPGTLDRIYAALLAYVGAQGLADIGKGAAEVRAAAVNPPQVATPPQPYSGAGLSAAGVLFLLLAVAGGTSACATARPRAAAATAAEIDCTAPAIATLAVDIGVSLRAWVLKHVAGDGRTIDLAQLKRDASALEGEAVGSCALVAALAILAAPSQAPAHQGLLATAAGPTPDDWRAALVEVRAELRVRAAP